MDPPDEARIERFLSRYAAAPKTSEPHWWPHSNELMHHARCGVLLVHNGMPIHFALDDGKFSELGTAEHMRWLATHCTQPGFCNDTWGDDGVLNSEEPGYIFAWTANTSYHRWGKYVIDPLSAAALEGLYGLTIPDHIGVSPPLGDMGAWIEGPVNVLTQRLKWVTEPVAALLAVYRMADRFGGNAAAQICDPLRAYLKEQMGPSNPVCRVLGPRPVGSMFAKTLPPLVHPPESSIPLVTIRIEVNGWPEAVEQLRFYAPSLPACSNANTMLHRRSRY